MRTLRTTFAFTKTTRTSLNRPPSSYIISNTAAHRPSALAAPSTRQIHTTTASMSWLAPVNQPSSSSNTPTTANTTSSSSSTFPPPSLATLAADLSSLLQSKSLTVSVAETAAGGLLSSSLLSQPGASRIYRGGLTLYTLESRIKYAGWTQDSISSYRGPTTDIVAGIAKHVRKDLGSDFTIAESGTAGPTGGQTRNRQPGYVALAVDCERGTFVREVETGLGTDRTANMVRFAEEALRFLKEVVNGEAKL